MSNPYAPPTTSDPAPEQPSNKDTILRRLGALSFGYITVSILMRNWTNLQETWGPTALMVVLIYGFLRGGRKFHLGIALYMAFGIVVQTYLTNRAIAHPERLPISLGPHPWLDFAKALAPHAIALVCATALYLRARRAARQA